MDSNVNQSQTEPESTANEAQDAADKRETPSKKQWRGSKQIYTKLMIQMEFYFSASNLNKDKFMTKLIQDDPYVPLSMFMSFNKIKNLLNGGNEVILRKALARSTILELSEDQTKVRRKEDVPLKTQEEIDECTLYVEQIPINSNHESLKVIFERFGKVAYVSLPRYKKSRQIKQFGFVEYEDKESITKAIQSFKKFDGLLQYASLKAENLLSITTHEKEEPENVEQKAEDDNNDTGEPPAKKSKVETVEEEKATEVPVAEEPVEESVSEVEMSSQEDKKEETSEKVEGAGDEVVKKKKNRQHKKKSGAAKLQDERIMAMKIMRKKEWKKMRNAYLNLERQKAKEIKKILRESYNKRNNNKALESQKFSPVVIASPRINFYGSPNDRADPVPEPETHGDTNATSGLTFSPGVIVNIKFREQCLDFKELKKEFKQYPYVQYVDILEGGAQCFIRVDAPNSAQELVSQYSSCEYETDVLKDEAEKEYWKKIFDKRDTKKTKETPKKEQPPVKRRRGREKLLDKIAKAAQHIRFEETEMAVE